MGADQQSGFERAVAVEAIGAGRYRAAVTGDWDGPAAPNGGLLAAIMVRAAQAELGAAAPPPRSVSAHFLDAPAHGPVEVTVELLRVGKRVSVCDVRMRQTERLVAQMTLVCSAARPHGRSLGNELPEELGFDLAATFKQGETPAVGVFDQVTLHPVVGSAIFSQAPDAVTGGWLGLRDDEAALDAARLCALCDLWWPAIFGWLDGPDAVPTLQLTVYLRSTEESVHGPVRTRFETRRLHEGHIEERGELWSQDGQLLAESHQLALLMPLPAT